MTEERKELTNEEKMQRKIDRLEEAGSKVCIYHDGNIEITGIDGVLHPKAIEICIDKYGNCVSLKEIIRSYKALAELTRITTAGLREEIKRDNRRGA